MAGCGQPFRATARLERPPARGGAGLRGGEPERQHLDAHHRRPQPGRGRVLRRGRDIRRPGGALRRRHPRVAGAGPRRPEERRLGDPDPLLGDTPLRRPPRHRRGAQGPGRDLRGAEPGPAAPRQGRIPGHALLVRGPGRRRDAGEDTGRLHQVRRRAGRAAAGAGLLRGGPGPGQGGRRPDGPVPRRQGTDGGLRAGHGDPVPAALRGLRRGQGAPPVQHQPPLSRPLPHKDGRPAVGGQTHRPDHLRRPGHRPLGRLPATLAGGRSRKRRLGRARLRRRPLLRGPGPEPGGGGAGLPAAHRRRVRPGPGAPAHRPGPRRGGRPGRFPVAVGARVRNHLRRAPRVAPVRGTGRPHRPQGQGQGDVRPRPPGGRPGGDRSGGGVPLQPVGGAQGHRQLLHQALRSGAPAGPRPGTGAGRPHRPARPAAGGGRRSRIVRGFLRLPMRRHRHGVGPLPGGGPRPHRGQTLGLADP